MARNQIGEQSNTTQKATAGNESAATQHEGRGWHGDSEGHAEAGRKGGKIVSQDKNHMAEIGRKGGQTVSQNRAHMAEIGRKGGMRRGASRDA